MTSTNATTKSESSPTNGSQPLSKSQKKRMKQKASRAKREAREREEQASGMKSQEQESSSNLASAASLNPHVKLRNDLVARGFDRDEIETALGEMWDLGMQYDEFDAALAYLEGKRAQREADKAAAAAEAAATEAINAAAEVVLSKKSHPAADEEDTMASSTAAVASSSTEEETESTEISASTEFSKAKLSANEAGETSAPSPPPETAAAPSPPVPMDLASKLDVVANFENLHDAVFALAEWVEKAAKPYEIMDLCIENKSGGAAALHTVVRRCIIECRTDSEFNDLLPSLRVLIGGILNPFSCEKSGDGKKLVAEKLCKSISIARDAVAKSRKADKYFDEGGIIPLQDSIATSVSKFITSTLASSLAKVIDESKIDTVGAEPLSTGEEQSDLVMIQKIEDEINSLLLQLPKRGNGVLELMTRRDCQKIAAEKSCNLTKLVIDIVVGGKKDDVVGGASLESAESQTDGELRLSSEKGKLEMFSSLLANNLRTVQENRAVFENIQNQLRSLQTEKSMVQTEVTAELMSCQRERERIERRREELRREMEQLDLESDAVLAREFELTTKLEKINSDPNEEMNLLRNEQEKMYGIISVDEVVKSVVNELSQYESYLVDLSLSALDKKKVQQENQLNPDDKVNISERIDLGTKMSSFFVQMRNYFVAEKDIVGFLQGRIASLQVELKGLQREVAECTALGMTTNVSQMTHSLDEITRNLNDDESVVNALRAEAEKMKDLLIQRTEEYTSLGNEPTTADHSVLMEISVLLSRLGVGYGSSSFLVPSVASAESSVIGRANQPDIAVHRKENASIRPAPGLEKQDHNILSQTSPLIPSVGNPADTSSYTQLPNATAVAAAMPKLSWAVPKTGATKKAGVKSLLDIQKEELSAKEAS